MAAAGRHPGGLAIAGMGGSGVAGALARAAPARAWRRRSSWRATRLPAWTGPQTLVLCSSYSGNMEKTLAAYEGGGEAGAPRAVRASGGELPARARDGRRSSRSGRLPAGAAVGDSFAVALEVAAVAGAAPSVRRRARARRAARARAGGGWGPRAPMTARPSGSPGPSTRRSRRSPEPGIGAAAAYRWKRQLNENAKVPAFAAELPEAGQTRSSAGRRRRRSRCSPPSSSRTPTRASGWRRAIELTRRSSAARRGRSSACAARRDARAAALSHVLLGDLCRSTSPCCAAPTRRHRADRPAQGRAWRLATGCVVSARARRATASAGSERGRIAGGPRHRAGCRRPAATPARAGRESRGAGGRDPPRLAQDRASRARDRAGPHAGRSRRLAAARRAASTSSAAASCGASATSRPRPRRRRTPRARPREAEARDQVRHAADAAQPLRRPSPIRSGLPRTPNQIAAMRPHLVASTACAPTARAEPDAARRCRSGARAGAGPPPSDRERAGRRPPRARGRQTRRAGAARRHGGPLPHADPRPGGPFAALDVPVGTSAPRRPTGRPGGARGARPRGAAAGLTMRACTGARSGRARRTASPPRRAPAEFIGHAPHHRLHRRRPAARGRARRPPDVHEPCPHDEVVAEVRSRRRDLRGRLPRRPHRAGRMGRVPAPVRGRVIANVGRLVEANKEALSRLVTQEVGKPYAEALGEVQETIDTCDFFSARAGACTARPCRRDARQAALHVPRPGRRRRDRHRRQLPGRGAVLVPGAGAAVRQRDRVEAGRLRARAGDALARLFNAGGVPGGVLNIVQAGGGGDVRRPRAALERVVDKVGFTGSTAVGAKIGELCGRHLQSPCLELGGKNPLVVMDDADLELAVEGALSPASAPPASAARRSGARSSRGRVRRVR